MTATALEAEIALPDLFELELPNEDEAPARSRRFVAEVLTRWGLNEVLVADAKLVVSELVTNAIRHTGSRQVTVSCQKAGRGGAEIAVHDFSREVPVLVKGGTGQDEGGRGLLLVEELCKGRWGIRQGIVGKVVWADIRASRRQLPPSADSAPTEADGGES